MMKVTVYGWLWRDVHNKYPMAKMINSNLGREGRERRSGNYEKQFMANCGRATLANEYIKRIFIPVVLLDNSIPIVAKSIKYEIR